MSARIFNRLISKNGETVTIRRREATVDPGSGSATYTFPEGKWLKTKALKYDASGLREEWYVIGIDVHVDFVLSFYSNLHDQLSIHDLIELDDGSLCEIVNIVKRGRGPIIDHVEVLARRVDYG